jgi:hypothetical protein
MIKKKNCEAACMQIYVAAIHKLQNEHFDDDARLLVRKARQANAGENDGL